ncbi:ATP-binding protein [Erwinia phyllosphaerae]|uniref:ATP-binding protein n=1 Tax=Erwinia phyllosphaerae TaxID=2853256 RepID=UPI001FEF0DFA|nr:ATP-binding protein [Erwinia phyllosphaerae]MBV4365780.1 ATP-binding protein [Erwinia phyllosphaerae]
MTHQVPDEEWLFPATLNSLTMLGSVLRRYLAHFPVDESWIYPLDLALCEAASNIIRHGYPTRQEADYRVAFSHDAGAITVMLIDSGVPVPAAQLSSAPSVDDALPELENLSEGGRGIALMYACVDKICYRSDGGVNRLALSKMLPPVNR